MCSPGAHPGREEETNTSDMESGLCHPSIPGSQQSFVSESLRLFESIPAHHLWAYILALLCFRAMQKLRVARL